MSWKHTFLVVTGCALAGMVMGGLFGFGAAKITPDFFRHIMPWQDVEPVGVAAFLGATAGVLLGGALGCFAILIQLCTPEEERRRGLNGRRGDLPHRFAVGINRFPFYPLSGQW